MKNERAREKKKGREKNMYGNEFRDRDGDERERKEAAMWTEIRVHVSIVPEGLSSPERTKSGEKDEGFRKG